MCSVRSSTLSPSSGPPRSRGACFGSATSLSSRSRCCCPACSGGACAYIACECDNFNYHLRLAMTKKQRLSASPSSAADFPQMPGNRTKFRCRPTRPNRAQPIDLPLFSGREGQFLDAKPGLLPELREVCGVSALDGIECGEAVAVLGIVPALEVGRALLGKGGARLHQIALGAVLAQRGGETLHLRAGGRAHLAHHVDGVDARGRRQGQEMLGHREGARDQLIGLDQAV